MNRLVGQVGDEIGATAADEEFKIALSILRDKIVAKKISDD